MYTIAEAIQAMHALHLKHLDVKPKNILVFDKFEVKLADMGSAKVETDQSKSNVCVSSSLSASALEEESYGNSYDSMRQSGTPGYCAPDAVQTLASDLYSFGMTCVHIINCKRPPTEGWLRDVKMAKTTLNTRELYPQDVSDILSDLLTRCLDNNPSKRPTAGYCIETLGALLERYPVTEEDISTLNGWCKKVE
jgi:serine/threonine protein kinase